MFETHAGEHALDAIEAEDIAKSARTKSKTVGLLIGSPTLRRQVVELAVVDVGASSAQRFFPLIETLLGGAGREGQIVAHSGRRLGAGPRRIIRSVVVEPGDDAKYGSEVAEHRNARLNFGALKNRQPVLPINFGVNQLDERRSADPGQPAPRLEGHFAVTHFDQSSAHASDLFPIGVDV